MLGLKKCASSRGLCKNIKQLRFVYACMLLCVLPLGALLLSAGEPMATPSSGLRRHYHCSTLLAGGKFLLCGTDVGDMVVYGWSKRTDIEMIFTTTSSDQMYHNLAFYHSVPSDMCTFLHVIPKSPSERDIVYVNSLTKLCVAVTHPMRVLAFTRSP